MKKGFIFSMSVIFFVVLVIVFFSLFIFVYQKPIYKERIVIYEKNIYKFMSGQSSESEASAQTKWCSTYLYYDLTNSDTQSSIIKKEYCEDYGTKRFI